MNSTTFNFGLGMTAGLLLTSFAFNRPALSALAFQSSMFAAGAALEKLEHSKAERLRREEYLAECLELAAEQASFWDLKYQDLEAFHHKLIQEKNEQSI